MAHYDSVAIASAGTEDGIRELEALLEDRLSHPIDDRLLKKMFAAQTEFRKRQTELVSQLERNKLTADMYLSRLTSEMERLMEGYKELLGTNDFDMVYGEAGLNPGSIVDRNIFLGETRLKGSA
jgi:hypothetical protein